MPILDQVLEVANNPQAMEQIKQTVGVITEKVSDYAKNKDLGAIDRAFLDGKLTPQGYIATTVVCSISSYFKNSQENERALVQMIQTISHQVVESSSKAVEQALKNSEEKIKILKEFTEKCTAQMEKASQQAYAENNKLSTLEPSEAILKALKDDPQALLKYLDTHEQKLLKLLENVEKIKTDSINGANKQIQELTQLTNALMEGDAAFLKECISFYQKLMTDVSKTLDEVRKNNVGLVQQVVGVIRDRITANSNNPPQANNNTTQSPLITGSIFPSQQATSVSSSGQNQSVNVISQNVTSN